jgi:hypothetical protein
VAAEREGRTIAAGALIGHADAVSQDTTIRLTERLEMGGVRTSIGSVGDAHDNALAECVIGLHKTECIRTTVFHPGSYRTISGVEYATAGWVDGYNQRRPHSSLAPSPRPSRKPPNMRPSTESRNPYGSGREHRAIQGDVELGLRAEAGTTSKTLATAAGEVTVWDGGPLEHGRTTSHVAASGGGLGMASVRRGAVCGSMLPPTASQGGGTPVPSPEWAWRLVPIAARTRTRAGTPWRG